MTLIDWFFIPLGPLDWRSGSNGWKTSRLVLDIEPLGLPFDYFITKVIRDIYSISSLPKLETRAPYYIKDESVGLRFQMKKKAKEFKMGLDAQKSFA